MHYLLTLLLALLLLAGPAPANIPETSPPTNENFQSQSAPELTEDQRQLRADMLEACEEWNETEHTDCVVIGNSWEMRIHITLARMDANLGEIIKSMIATWFYVGGTSFSVSIHSNHQPGDWLTLIYELHYDGKVTVRSPEGMLLE